MVHLKRNRKKMIDTINEWCDKKIKKHVKWVLKINEYSNIIVYGINSIFPSDKTIKNMLNEYSNIIFIE